jgi:hypothetical protein
LQSTSNSESAKWTAFAIEVKIMLVGLVEFAVAIQLSTNLSNLITN